MSMLNMLLGSGAKTALTWSGNSIGTWAAYGYNAGIQTSDNQFRHVYNYGGDYGGSWQSVSLTGVFSGSSLNGVSFGYGTSGSSIRMQTSINQGVWISYNSVSKTFSSGASQAFDANDDIHQLDASGGLIRGSFLTTYFGQYISLT